jgi:hypothetical protein
MLLLGAFLAIGALFIALLLRFLFALESEARLERERAAWVKQIRSSRTPSAPGGLALVYSNPYRAPALRGSEQARPAASVSARIRRSAR